MLYTSVKEDNKVDILLTSHMGKLNLNSITKDSFSINMSVIFILFFFS